MKNIWILSRTQLVSSEREYYWCSIAPQHAVCILQYLTGIRGSVSAACQWFFAQCSPLTCCCRRQICYCSRERFSFAVLGLWGSNPLLCFLPSFKSSIFLQCHHIKLPCKYFCLLLSAHSKEWHFNRRELWYREHPRKLPRVRRWKTEAKWSKAVIKANAHQTGWIKEKKHQNMEGYFITAFNIYMRYPGRRNTVTVHSQYFSPGVFWKSLLIHRDGCGSQA